MVVGMNAQAPGGKCRQFPSVFSYNAQTNKYNDMEADECLKNFNNQSYRVTFDDQDNLYVGSLNWGRVLIYVKPFATGKCE